MPLFDRLKHRYPYLLQRGVRAGRSQSGAAGSTDASGRARSRASSGPTSSPLVTGVAASDAELDLFEQAYHAAAAGA